MVYTSDPQANSSYNGCTVTKFSNGSIIAYFTITFLEYDSLMNATQLEDSLQESVSTGFFNDTFIVPPESVNVDITRKRYLLLVVHSLHGSAPQYNCQLITRYNSSRGLRSSTSS